jgi:23S rRNA maturation-related 3'-5' exoribonuclease YhaM
MDYEKVFKLAEPYLKKNEFGMPHTRRVFDIAKQNFEIPQESEELVFCSIILHDIGGSSIQKQYEEGPKIAATILRKLGYDEVFVKEICEIVRTHHDHPDHPPLAFKILHDSDKLVMFSPQEFPHYNSHPTFIWNKIIDLVYSQHCRDLAKNLLRQRRSEVKEIET